PETFNEKRGHPRLRMRHAQFHIDEAARDRWLELMANAMETVDEKTLPAEHRAAMWDHMERVAQMLVNEPTMRSGRSWDAYGRRARPPGGGAQRVPKPPSGGIHGPVAATRPPWSWRPGYWSCSAAGGGLAAPVGPAGATIRPVMFTSWGAAPP